MKTKYVYPSGDTGGYSLIVHVPEQQKQEETDWKQLDDLVDKILERIVPANRLKT